MRSSIYIDEEGFCRNVTVQEVITKNYNLLPAAYVNRGHLKAAGGPILDDVIHSPAREKASRSLEKMADLSCAFEQALRMVEDQVHLLEEEVQFRTMPLGDLLERSDEQLGDTEEPEVLTCTESGGLILQRERFAKRVATDDASKYKVVRMGDIVYNPYLLWKGSIDQCWIVEIGITSPAYEVLRVRSRFDPSIVGQLVTSPEMIRRYDGISFGTVQRRRRAPVERFLELKVNFPVGASLDSISALLNAAQDSQFASRNSERAIRSFIRRICERLR
jgi:type I restriction enzyme M protein